ncbi:MAG: glycosyltransferase [Thermodesulfovibrionales bacterium]|nr:glycosyltransferase [Thermodesulfovibrionales bacterium]
MNSFVIPVLDFSPHSDFNILTLLKDLENIEGEVICIFNSKEVFERLEGNKRIDKYCYNKTNAGVSRSWNIGINLAEGDVIFVMNADLHITQQCVKEMRQYCLTLEKAVIVGPQGSHLDFRNLKVNRYFKKGTFDKPIKTHDVSGFLFAINTERFRENRLCFDVRFSPCFFEEWDMGLQIMSAGLYLYAVPVTGFEHHWGMSQAEDERIINYFGRDLKRGDVMIENRKRFIRKWSHMIRFSEDLLKEATI